MNPVSDHRPRPIFFSVLLVLLVLLPTSVPLAADDQADEEVAELRFDPTLFQALGWRNIGPFRGGRATAVTGIAGDPLTYFFGSTGGGVWRTRDGGTTWHNVSDGHFHTGSVGAIAVAPSDRNVVYVGMGEAPVRGVMTTHGDGIYRSTDGGDTWQHLGLDDSRHIARIQVHPDDPDHLWVAVQGHLWGPNEERGVYRSTDGGTTWEAVLHVDDDTGATDLALDVTNPRVVYAAMWHHRRKPWVVESGPRSSIWKTTDGGETWQQLENGLPAEMGKVGVAVSPADPKRVWVLAEAEEGGLFRSDDGGTSFTLINDDRELRARAWYYTHVFADSQDANRVYVANAPFLRSIDGGTSFTRVRTPHGDNHDVWINPANNQWMINANDGGANVSWNGGETWSTQANQPTGQFYRVITDNRFPYWVYGGQQDNSAIAIKSRSMSGGITTRDWHNIGGCESAFPAFDPDDPRYIYAGCYQGIIDEFDMRTEQRRGIMAYPFLGLGSVPRDNRYRFNWNAPILTSPHDRSVIYHAGNHVLRSSDRGRSWQEISPDLTRDEDEKQGPGGTPITREGAGGETYNTLLSLVASPHQAGVLWSGSDDGLVHTTRDDGVSWQDVTPPDLGDAMINAIEVSPHDPSRVYLAATRYKWDDLTPYIFKTEDDGSTWRRIDDALPADTIVRVVREDPGRAGLLYAGTERGVFVSFDEGVRWQPLENGLPVVPVTDLTIRNHDLVASTQGRAFWILDDLTPFHTLDDDVAEAPLHLFPPRPAVRTGGGRIPPRPGFTIGTNPDNGVVFHYLVAAEDEPEADDETEADEAATDAAAEENASPAEGETDESEGADGDDTEQDEPAALELEISDALGRVVRTVSSQPEGDDEPLPAKPGMNRWVWSMTGDPMIDVEEVLIFGSLDGYRLAPGRYLATLRKGETSTTQDFDVVPDPRLDAEPAAYTTQQELLATLRGRIMTIHDAVNRLRAARDQVGRLVALVEDHEHGEAIAEAGTTVTEAIDTWEEQLIQPKQQTFQDVINFPNQLNAEYLNLMGQADTFEPIVNDGVRERLADLDQEWAPLEVEQKRILDEDLATFNALFDEHRIPAVVVPETEIEP